MNTIISKTLDKTAPAVTISSLIIHSDVMVNDNADANALTALLLRHRLFPRAMAWNVQRQSKLLNTEQLVMTAQMQQTSRDHAMDVALSFPLIQASTGLDNTHDHRLRPVSTSLMSSAAKGDEHELLFRAVGKYLNALPLPTGPSSSTQNSPNYVQQISMYDQAPLADDCRLYSGMPSLDWITAEQQSTVQALKISSCAEEKGTSWGTSDHVLSEKMTTTSTLCPSLPEGYQIRLRSPLKLSMSDQQRTRGSTLLEAAATINASVVDKDEIAPSLARALLSGCGAKQCSYDGCKKIAVSKGRCRGHGGGRRCQQAGCTKCTQSRSPFCWAHGGGKRCEAANCRRSRKTKRFCVDHVDMELPASLKPALDNTIQSHSTKEVQPEEVKSAAMKSRSSSKKTSVSSYASADSDDSFGRQSTISCDSNFSVVHNKEKCRMPSAECVIGEQKYAQYDQYGREVFGVPPQSSQLPSLNEALLRTVPTPYSFDAMWSATRTSSPPAPHSSQYKVEY